MELGDLFGLFAGQKRVDFTCASLDGVTWSKLHIRGVRK